MRGRRRFGGARKFGSAASVVDSLEGETVADRVEGGRRCVVGS